MVLSPTSVCNTLPKTPTKALVQHIKRREWHAVRGRVLIYPYDAHYQPRHSSKTNQQTPLHLCCLYRAPIDVVELVVNANPGAILTQDSAGWTPIHIVIMHGGDTNIVILLIKRGGYLALAVQSPYAGTPLHLACRHGSSIEILQHLVEFNPQMTAVANENGIKPLQVVWYQFTKNPTNKQLLNDIVRANDGPRHNLKYEVLNDPVKSSALNDLFDRLQILVDGIKKKGPAEVRSETSVRNLDDEETKALSASLIRDMIVNQFELGVGNISEFLEIAVPMFPEQLQKVCDELTGRYLLHIAAAIPPCFPQKHGTNGANNASRDTIDILVDEYPIPAGIPDKHGDYPLHLALTKGKRSWKTGIKSLVCAQSEPLQCRDRHTKLYPFQIAAALPWGETKEESLGTIFEVLVACPHVVQC